MAGQQPRQGEPSERQEKEHQGDHPCIIWTGGSEKTPVVKFQPEGATGEVCLREVGERYHLAYKMARIGNSPVSTMLSAHGFQKVEASSSNFNLMWTGPYINTSVFAHLSKYQKINHFPNSMELGRKDLLCKNIQTLKKKHGAETYNFLPQSYLLPNDNQEFCKVISKDQGPWISKPVSACQGRGIQIINSFSQVNRREKLLVSRYIKNPLLVDGYKFDLRLFVLVTSYDPLIIYLYEEGLTRFATDKYNPTEQNMKNQFMHLTNTSINKGNANYVRSTNPEVENHGSLWSMGALLRHLKGLGKDTATLMSKIEELVIKTIISAEGSIGSVFQGTLAHRRKCFELYGFDVLVDETLKPWLLEVNLMPSLVSDGPLALKIKANLLADTLTLIGVQCQNTQQNIDKEGPTIAAKVKAGYQNTAAGQTEASLFQERMKIIREIKEEEERRGGFIRIFPHKETWKRYSNLLTYKSFNNMLACHLFTKKPSEPGSSSSGLGQHSALYERKLPPLRTNHEMALGQGSLSHSRATPKDVRRPLKNIQPRHLHAVKTSDQKASSVGVGQHSVLREQKQPLQQTKKSLSPSRSSHMRSERASKEVERQRMPILVKSKHLDNIRPHHLLATKLSDQKPSSSGPSAMYQQKLTPLQTSRPVDHVLTLKQVTKINSKKDCTQKSGYNSVSPSKVFHQSSERFPKDIMRRGLYGIRDSSKDSGSIRSVYPQPPVLESSLKSTARANIESLHHQSKMLARRGSNELLNIVTGFSSTYQNLRAELDRL
ncbi:tubulin polyglutamylase TTLL5 [Pelobates cultripes]|uniref:Tubulin--tyrosine ligase-like protein 5 n=1 Tax=Pelobates cultripes TaxID=61616 RepID=A0AAD1S510_PELCU|nr:tubulin polyglutamylase TTLL5 [Pelobates cultripes]